MELHSYFRLVSKCLIGINNELQLNYNSGYERESFWLSATDLGHEGTFVWLNTGLPMVYKNFRKNQPDNAGGNENCIEMHGNGEWNDILCHNAFYSICQF